MEEEAPAVSSYLDNVILQTEDKYDQMQNVVWGIEDTQQVWENQIDQINLKIFEKANELGLGKNKVEDRFEEFNIVDMVKQVSACENCSKGLRCQQHAITRRDANVKNTIRENENNKMDQVRKVRKLSEI